MKKILMNVCLILMVVMCCITPVSAERYVLPEGTKYYQSAWGFGSGRFGVVSTENRYTVSPCEVSLDGYAALDSEGRVLQSHYQPRQKGQAEESYQLPDKYPEGTYKVFVHHASDGYRLGWSDLEDLEELKETPPHETSSTVESTGENLLHAENEGSLVISDEEKDPERIVEEITEISTSNESDKTILIVDCSGSMAPHQAEVIRQLEKLPLDNLAGIWVFATEYKQVSKEELIAGRFDVGALTYMNHALCEILWSENNVTNVILIGDLYSMDYHYGLPGLDGIRKVHIYDTEWYVNTEPEWYRDAGYVDDPRMLHLMQTAWPNAEITWSEIAK